MAEERILSDEEWQRVLDMAMRQMGPPARRARKAYSPRETNPWVL